MYVHANLNKKEIQKILYKMNDYAISIIENIDQFNKIYGKFYDQSLSGDANKGVHIIGLDCEYITNVSYPKSHEEANWCVNKGDTIVCKIQLATQNMCLIIDLCKMGKILPENLIQIIRSESWLKFGAGTTLDIDCLSRQYNLGNCNGVINASILCTYFGSTNSNLENLYNSLSKTKEPFKKIEVKGRDWSQEMTVQQIKYAAEDAYASYIIGYELMNHMKKSLGIIFTKYEQEDNLPLVDKNIISVQVSDENYVGMLMEYCQKNKLGTPEYQYYIDGNSFYCVCKLKKNSEEIIEKSDSFTNKKDCKQNVSNKIMNRINRNI